MQPISNSFWLAVIALTAAIVTALWPAGDWLRARVSGRLAIRYRLSLAELSEIDAARLIRRLADSDAQWLEVLVAASGDERADVAKAAATELQDLVARWQIQPAEDNAAWVAELARLLAQHAPQLPPHRRHLPHALAQQLIDWPVDGRLIDAAQLLAHCESVLLLPRSDEPDIRVAAVPGQH